MSGPALFDPAACVPALGDRLTRRLEAVLAAGRFVLGPEVAELEATLAHRGGAAAAVGCASGTDALKLAMLVRRIGQGDAVFVPAFTFIATAEAAVAIGATPVFVDIGEDMTMDPDDLAERIDAVRRDGTLRSAAVIPVDLFGLPARYAALTEAAGGVPLIADAAQSFGATNGGTPVGAMAPLSTLSFYPTKPLGCFGDGGAVLAMDPDDAATLRALRQHGFDAGRSDVARVGMNSRLDTVQAAVLLARLELFDAEMERRREIAATYHRLLDGAVTRPAMDDRQSAWALYTVRTPERDRLRTALAERGIGCGVYYARLIPDQPAYAPYRALAGPLTVSEAARDTVLSLPLHPYMSVADAERVAAVVRETVGTVA